MRIDQRVMGKTPLGVVKVSPGPHQISIWAEGHASTSLNLDVAAGATVPVVASLRPLREGESPAEEPPNSSALAWTMALSGVVLAGGAIAMTVVAAGQEEDADVLAGTATVDNLEEIKARVTQEYDGAGTKRNVGFALGATALAAGAAAIWLWPDAQPAVSVRPIPGGASIAFAY